MASLSEEQLLLTLLSLAVILLIARAFGELARRIHQPEVLGELFAGFVLGPSVLGHFLPRLQTLLFADQAAGRVLSAFSWVGAILLLLIAGIEVDLDILRKEARPGIFAAAGAIIPSLVIGALFSLQVLEQPFPHAVYLGIVLSVTAVSVVAKVLIEREELRRRYAQVTLAAGIAGEVLVWLLVSIASATGHASPILTALRSAFYAVVFFAFMVLVGQRVTFWLMRWVADATTIIKGQLSLVLLLAFLSAALTQRLGLHGLLGAFVFGVLLSRAPRTNKPLLDSIQTLTTGLFAPVFFVLAGMRVNVLELRTSAMWLSVLSLFAVATLVKVGAATLGARLGGIRGWESALVGVGLNFKGGTDVIVAIIGVELGLLSQAVYTMYAVVAIATVLVSPAVVGWLAKKAPPAPEELDRLQKEHAASRAYLPRIERVLVPVATRALPMLPAEVLKTIASAKQQQGELFDISEFVAEPAQSTPGEASVAEAVNSLQETQTLENVTLKQRRMSQRGLLRHILEASKGHDLIALGAHLPTKKRSLSFGWLQDAILQRAETDVLLIATPEAAHAETAASKRILVPVNGMEYSMAAADLAGYVALGTGAQIVLFNTVYSEMDSLFWRERDHRRLFESAQSILAESAFRLSRLGVKVSKQVVVGHFPGSEVIRELQRVRYDLVVLGCYNRSMGGRFSFGTAIETVLRRGGTPTVLLVSHEAPREHLH